MPAPHSAPCSTDPQSVAIPETVAYVAPRSAGRGAIEQVLSGELVIEDLDPSMTGRGVGKNIQIRPALLEKLMQAAEEAGLSPTEWVKLAVYQRMEKDYKAESSRVQ